MKPIKEFEEYIFNGTVKKQAIDVSRAESLRKDSETSYLIVHEMINKLGLDDRNANTIIKISYDTIMDAIRAKMLSNGFNSSGQGAHEAEVSYLRKLNISENDVQFCDQLRYFRNRIMYYGKVLDKEYAEKVVSFLDKVCKELHKGSKKP